MNQNVTQEDAATAKKNWLESRTALCAASFIVFFLCGLCSVASQAYLHDEVWTRTQFLQAASLRALVAVILFNGFYWPIFNRITKKK